MATKKAAKKGGKGAGKSAKGMQPGLLAAGAVAGTDAADVAEKAVVSACASMTNFVKIINFEPLEISPNDLADRTFQEVGILDTGTFKQLLIHFLPAQMSADIGGLDVPATIRIGSIIDWVLGKLLSL